jgi:hypothetical protein
MTKQERQKLDEKYYGEDSYYDDIPPYIHEMSPEELDRAIAEEEARLLAESKNSDAA